MSKVEKIKAEIERLKNELIQEKEKGYGSDVDDACILELQNILTYIDSLQEEPVSNDLEEVSKKYSSCTYLEEVLSDDDKEVLKERLVNTFKAGANWQKEHLWKPADGDDLPEIDREVIALLSNGKVVYAHRPQEYWDGKNITTGEVTRHYPVRHDKGGWNIPDVKFWLDCELFEIEE